MSYRGYTWAVGPSHDLYCVYSYLLENKQYFRGGTYEEITLERQYVRASWAGEYPAVIKAPALSRKYPRVGIGTVWGCPGSFIAYGVYAAGIEELRLENSFRTQGEGLHFFEQACAIVEGHLAVVAIKNRPIPFGII